MRKLRLREVKELAQGNSEWTGIAELQNPGLSDSKIDTNPNTPTN